MSLYKFAQTIKVKGVEADITIDITASQYQDLLANRSIAPLVPLVVEAVFMQSIHVGGVTHDTWYYPESGECKVFRSFGNPDEE